MRLGDSLTAILRTEDAREALGAVFGLPYSRKEQWPDTLVMTGPSAH
jgi:hypothetical protein